MKILLSEGGSVLQLASENPDDAQFLKKLVTDYMSPMKPPVAEVFIRLLPDGLMHLRSERNGRFDSSYPDLPQERVMSLELPKLIAELQHTSV